MQKKSSLFCFSFPRFGSHYLCLPCLSRASVGSTPATATAFKTRIHPPTHQAGWRRGAAWRGQQQAGDLQQGRRQGPTRCDPGGTRHEHLLCLSRASVGSTRASVTAFKTRIHPPTHQAGWRGAAWRGQHHICVKLHIHTYKYIYNYVHVHIYIHICIHVYSYMDI